MITLFFLPCSVPVDLPAPEVEAVRSDALSVTIFEPLQPNGQIILYNVILYVRRLTPF